MDAVLLREEALRLSAYDKAQLIDALWDSLESAETAAIEHAWVEESKDRLAAYRRGEIQAVDGPQALKQLEAELGR